eukprot:jgi/Psemu1/61835/gm1.61835_g
MVNVREEEDKKYKKEVAMNPTLKEDDTDKNEEAAANDTDPIAVAADCASQEEVASDLALQEDGTENMEE